MQSKKFKVSAILFYSFITVLALALPNMAFALQSGDFTYTESGGTITITGYGGCSTTEPVIIPSVINGMPVVGIGDWAFAGCTGLTSVTIGNGVTDIGFHAFEGCTGLTSVTIPNSVVDIADHAFYCCIGLTSVNIPKSVTNIGTYAFARCTGLTSIVVDASNTTYSSQDGLLYNKAMTVLIQYPCATAGVTIPDSVTYIGDYAFYGCTNLSSFSIPDSITSIENEAFEGCTGLTSVTIPNSVRRIKYEAFEGCTGLTSVTIPDSVTSIGELAFAQSSGLTKAYFLGNAPSMGSDVFYKCSSNFTVCYTAGSTGFTNPWDGYPAAVCEEKKCAAEAIYGRNSEETELLREYRDKVLSKSATGRQMIKTYYELPPAVVEALQKNDTARASARRVLDSLMPAIREKVKQ